MSRYRRPGGPSLWRGQWTTYHFGFCCHAGVARMLSLLYSWIRRPSAHMLPSGLRFGIASPFSLEIFGGDILAWHLRSTKIRTEGVSEAPRTHLNVKFQHPVVKPFFFSKGNRKRGQEGSLPPLKTTVPAAHHSSCSILNEHQIHFPANTIM